MSSEDLVERYIVRRQWHSNQHFMENNRNYRVKISGAKPGSTHAFKEVLIGKVTVKPKTHFHMPEKFSHLISSVSAHGEKVEIYKSKLFLTEVDSLTPGLRYYEERNLVAKENPPKVI